MELVTATHRIGPPRLLLLLQAREQGGPRARSLPPRDAHRRLGRRAADSKLQVKLPLQVRPGPGPRLVVEVTVKAVTNVRGSHNLKLFQPTAAGTVVAMWSWHDFTASGESLARFKLAAGGASPDQGARAVLDSESDRDSESSREGPRTLYHSAQRLIGGSKNKSSRPAGSGAGPGPVTH